MELIPRTRITIGIDGTLVNGALMAQALIITPATLPFNTEVTPYLADAQEYVIDTGVSLSASVNIALSTDPSIAAFPGMVYRFRYMGRIATFTNNATVTILGTTLTSAQAGQWLNITMEYALGTETNTGVWIPTITPMKPNSSYVSGYGSIAVTLGGATKTLVVGTDNTNQAVTGSGSLTGSYAVTATGLNAGDTFIFHYGATITLGAYALSFMGYALTPAQALQNLTVTAIYNGSAWEVTAVESITSQPNNNPGITKVTLTGASQVSQTLTPGVSKEVLELAGNTTLTGNYSVTLANPSSGEANFQVVVKATLQLSTDTLTICGNVINAAMALAGGYTVFAWWDSVNSVWITQVTWYNPYTNQYSTKVTIPTASVLTGYTAPVLVIPAPPSSQQIKILPSSSWAVTFNTTPYATHLEQALSCGDTATPPNLATIAQYVDSAALGTSVSTIPPRTGFFTQNGLSGATSTQIIAGQGIYWWVEAGNPTAGDSSVVLYLDYEIVTL